MTILVTGHKGFIGSELVEFLKSAHSVIGIDKKDGKDVKELTINDLYGVDVVVHLAAQTSVWNTNYWQILHDNVLSFAHIFFLCKRLKIKFIYASSSCSYNITSLYGLSKKFDEYLSSWYNYGVGLRFHNVYGKNSRKDTLLGICLENDTVNLYNNGQNKRHFTYIKDILNCIEKSFSLPDGIYNCFNEEENTTLEFCNEVKRYKRLKINLLDEIRDKDKVKQDIDKHYINLINKGKTIYEGLRDMYGKKRK